ncbi:YraN family protein [Homoserinibacter sp. GY 40078]|uniref:YraN family protein n=1 Tax=Homoserinibacter sp. GY 40078 TaxID=2603275 RepID=UPI0011CB5BA8|nr:YraN family protein [Homoserinibacter sp. GY 40078]TXK17042.1 YraN family protein [Homoserinibacter sp. GY 40078]
MAAKDDLGRRGERIAERHLTARGFRVLARNWRCRHGELDLVMRDGESLVFVEVKTRASTLFGHPFEAITPAKLARLRRLAGLWREEHPGEPGRMRIDAVSVLAPVGDDPVVEHLVGVF